MQRDGLNLVTLRLYRQAYIQAFNFLSLDIVPWTTVACVTPISYFTRMARNEFLFCSVPIRVLTLCAVSLQMVMCVLPILGLGFAAFVLVVVSRLVSR